MKNKSLAEKILTMVRFYPDQPIIYYLRQIREEENYPDRNYFYQTVSRLTKEKRIQKTKFINHNNRIEYHLRSLE